MVPLEGVLETSVMSGAAAPGSEKTLAPGTLSLTARAAAIYFPKESIFIQTCQNGIKGLKLWPGFIGFRGSRETIWILKTFGSGLSSTDSLHDLGQII